MASLSVIGRAGYAPPAHGHCRGVPTMPADHLSWVPADTDLSRPNVARVYDYVLGGANNFEVDREFAKRLLSTMPDAQFLAQENRAFLRRTVSYLTATAGVHQFIDLGSGLPTVGH